MNKKLIFTGFISIMIFSLLFGYSLVFAGTGIFDTTTNVVFKLSENIYLDSLELKNTKILFKSGEDLDNYKIKSECNIFSKLTHSKGDFYMFDLKFFDNNCTNSNFILVDENSEIKSKFTLNLVKENDLLSKLFDLKTTRLVQLKNILDKKVLTNSKYDKYDKEVEENYYTYLEKNRSLKEAIYSLGIITNIIEKRQEKYIVPVLGRKMPTTSAKIPNSSRTYRNDYTDGIHHGWDIDGNFGEQVIALDEGIIVRVVDEFDFSDLNIIKRGNNLTYDEKVRNLDILRGNQVWIKTTSGDVVMYSHLNDIFSNIEIGESIRKGQPLGTIGITGVPDKNYTDFHLHFVVHKNPFITEKVGSYDIDDYMKWDWAFKGETTAYIIENQGKYFQ
ncbi:MAG: M23 family metallopeptidase [Candidatus Gracilibacteria bacterium]